MTNGDDLIDSFAGTSTHVANYGLTKREYFAAMAMQGLLANTNYNSTDDAVLAMTCTDAADALIKALNINTDNK